MVYTKIITNIYTPKVLQNLHFQYAAKIGILKIYRLHINNSMQISSLQNQSQQVAGQLVLGEVLK